MRRKSFFALKSVLEVMKTMNSFNINHAFNCIYCTVMIKNDADIRNCIININFGKLVCFYYVNGNKINVVIIHNTCGFVDL